MYNNAPPNIHRGYNNNKDSIIPSNNGAILPDALYAKVDWTKKTPWGRNGAKNGAGKCANSLTENFTRHYDASSSLACASKKYEQFLDGTTKSKESYSPFFEPIKSTSREKDAQNRAKAAVYSASKKINFDMLKQEMLKSSFRTRRNGVVRRTRRLPPVCGRSPPCDCPQDQVFASKLRIRKPFCQAVKYFTIIQGFGSDKPL